VIERGDPSGGLAFVLMHGYGAPGDDLVSLAEELVRRVPRPLRVVVPAAPIAMSHGARAWYEIDSPEAAAQTERACVAIEGMIATLSASGVPASRVSVGGFSQGGILSIEAALRGHARLAGIVVLSGRALPHDESDYRRLASLRIFQAHGRSDARIAFAQGEAFGAAATRAGAVLEPVVFDGGHTIPPDVVVALARWIGEIA
jgi:phospholipase/carboxylesterase